MQQPHLTKLLGIVCSVLDAYSAVLFLPSRRVDAEPGECSPSAFFSLGNTLERGVSVAEGKGLVGWILRNKEPLLVANFDRRNNRLGYYSEAEEQTIKAFMGCALPGRDGALCVDSKRQYSFSERDQKLLHLFAELISHMLAEEEGKSDARLMQRYFSALRALSMLRREHSRWADFLAAYLALVSSVSGFSYSVLCTRDPDGERFSAEGESYPLLMPPGEEPPSWPMTHGAAGWVFRNGTALMGDGEHKGTEGSASLVGPDGPQFPAVIALPLVIQRKTRGVLCLAHDVSLTVSGPTKDFARTAADYLALFLENLYVKSRLRDLHRQAFSAAADPGE